METTPIWDEEFADRWAELHPDEPAPACPCSCDACDEGGCCGNHCDTDTGTTSYDVADDGLPINPDCRAGKHKACAGDAWDLDADELTDCGCECHHDPTVVDVVEAL